MQFPDDGLPADQIKKCDSLSLLIPTLPRYCDHISLLLPSFTTLAGGGTLSSRTHLIRLIRFRCANPVTAATEPGR